MNGMTIFIWIAIAIIGIISIVAVKMHYKGNELGTDELSILNDNKTINKMINAGQNLLSKNSGNSNQSTQLNKYNVNDIGNDRISFKDTPAEPIIPNVEKAPEEPIIPNVEKAPEEPIVPQVEETPEEPIIPQVEKTPEEPVVPTVENETKKIKYESPNQVSIDYGNTVEKFQEPIKESQMNIMSQNNNPANEKRELKDLFTIDELIKESKRKDSEREKEIVSHEDDEEINELKESIKQKQNNEEIEESRIEEIIENHEETINEIIEDVETSESEENINDIVNTEDIAEETEEEVTEEIENPTVTSQDIEEVINTASQETDDEEVESISEGSGITDVLLDSTEEEEEIKEPILKTPTKVNENKDTEPEVEYENDLDYRKDLAKITNTIKGSKIFQDVKEKLISEPNNIEVNDTYEENYIRNVNEYDDEFAPIINETHSDYEATYEEYHENDYDERLRQQNTQKILNTVEASPEPIAEEPKIGAIKEKPARENIKVEINNTEYVIKKGDEIIFNHLGETYSSQVYAINGDDISVKYRRQNITIKPSDVKKVY